MSYVPAPTPLETKALPEFIARELRRLSNFLVPSVLWNLLNPLTSAEVDAGVRPVSHAYPAGNVKRYGAAGNGVSDDTAAIQAAISQAVALGAPVWFPPGRYRVTSGFVIARAISIYGEGTPSGGTGSENHPCAIILKQFSGDLFTFNGSSGATDGSGGGIENLRLVSDTGSSVTAAGAGVAIKLTGADTSHRPSWMKFRNLIIEYAPSRDSWTWGIDVDGTAITGSVIPDLWFSQVSTHTASSNGGAMRLLAAAAKVFDCAFYDSAGHVTISGVSGTPSRSITLYNADISGTLALDYANDVTVIGGIITTITNTANTAGNCTIIPGRLANAFTSASNNAGAAFGLIRHHSGGNGSWRVTHSLILENAQPIYGLTSSGASSPRLIDMNSSDQVVIAGDGSDIRWGRALVALGGGAAPTLGTIGGSGPATAAQNSWMRVIDSSGNPFWVPVWK